MSLSILVSSGYMLRSGIAGSYGDSLKKLRIKPPCDPAITQLGIYPKETKIERDTCIPLFTVALFTIARTWKQLRCPSTDEWIGSCGTCTQWDNYSAIKRNAFESVLMSIIE